MDEIDPDQLIQKAIEAAEIEKERARLRKAELKRLGRKPTKQDKRASMISAVRDIKTGRIFIGKSGEPHPFNIHPELKHNMPQQSLHNWNIENCAEFKACNEALYARLGAKIEEMESATVRVSTGEPQPRCLNCKITLQSATVFTD